MSDYLWTDDAHLFVMKLPPSPVGTWLINGGPISFSVYVKPNWLARIMAKQLLGWQWKDGK